MEEGKLDYSGKIHWVKEENQEQTQSVCDTKSRT